MTSSTAAVPGAVSPDASASGSSLGAGLAICAGYLAVFVTTWVVNGADYMHIGDTVESTRLPYAYPTLFAGLFAAAVVQAWLYRHARLLRDARPQHVLRPAGDRVPGPPGGGDDVRGGTGSVTRRPAVKAGLSILTRRPCG